NTTVIFLFCVKSRMVFTRKLFIAGIFYFIIPVNAAWLSGCRHAVVVPVVLPVATPASTVKVVELAPETDPLFLPDDTTDMIYHRLSRKEAIFDFYRLRANRLAWERNGNTTAVSDSLASFIRNIRYYGLLPQNYHHRELRELDFPVLSDGDLRRRDLLLTDAFLVVVNDIRNGRLSRADQRADSVNSLLLEKVLAEGILKENIARAEPQLEGYRGLKQALKRALDSAGTSERKMLLEGVTASTVPVHKLVRDIEINLERWRWEGNTFKGTYLLVNVPSFMLRLYTGDTLLLESRVIVGRPENPTPILSSVIECFITYPYWHVPRKISVEELLPSIQRDTTYLARNNFDVIDKSGKILDAASLDWKSFDKDYFPVSLRQREGADNSLGIIKFVFDNPYAVFLHDTNAKRLFRNETRAFSHGCIRMEKAEQLAHYLVTGDIKKRSEMVEKYLKQKTRHTVDARTDLPIHVRYFTAEFLSGQLYQYNDLYYRDARLAGALYSSMEEEALLSGEDN
ncbi:MAG TPA: L,D-transpeptidase family protein, partial [Chryseosolibacter sp.]